MRKGLEGGGFQGAQTAGLNALKNRWLGRVAARVAVERPAGGFGRFEGGQTAGLNAHKTDGWGVWLRELPRKGRLERS